MKVLIINLIHLSLLNELIYFACYLDTYMNEDSEERAPSKNADIEQMKRNNREGNGYDYPGKLSFQFPLIYQANI